MSELVIDNDHLNDLAECVEKEIEFLKKDISTLKNKDEDIFERYMAMSRCKTLLHILPNNFLSHKESMKLGFVLADKYFKTDSAKNHGWIPEEIKDNDFFIQESECDSKESKDEEQLKKFLAAAVMSAFLGKKR